jgi:hypothetical protein
MRRNQRFLCSRLRSGLLVERLGMQTRLTRRKAVARAFGAPRPAAGGNLPFVNNNAVVFYRNLKRLKLDMAQHVPIHGNPGGQADFERIVGPVGPVAARTPVAGDGN